MKIVNEKANETTYLNDFTDFTGHKRISQDHR